VVRTGLRRCERQGFVGHGKVIRTLDVSGSPSNA